jgi:hypothetical protein
MVLLPNMFKATSPATETLPVGRFFSHSSCSNDRDKARGNHPRKRRRGYSPSPSLTCYVAFSFRFRFAFRTKTTTQKMNRARKVTVNAKEEYTQIASLSADQRSGSAAF